MAGTEEKQYISKVVYGGHTLIDLTSDTVTEDKLLQGYTTHGADGAQITGTCTYDSDTQDANAADSEILLGKTAYVKGVKKTGTMPNNGGVTGTISSKEESYTIPSGYHDGSGKVQLNPTEKAKLIAENIREGITILGVLGSMSGAEDVVPQAKTITPTGMQQIVLPDTESGYNYLSQVTVEAIPYSESENSAGGLTVTIG